LIKVSPHHQARCDLAALGRSDADRLVRKANPEYLSVNWEASGGGAFAVIPLNEKGKLPDQIPLFRGHTATVLDTDWWARDLDLQTSLAI
jgi:coronin-1B/1C/6